MLRHTLGARSAFFSQTPREPSDKLDCTPEPLIPDLVLTFHFLSGPEPRLAPSHTGDRDHSEERARAAGQDACGDGQGFPGGGETSEDVRHLGTP